MTLRIGIIGAGKIVEDAHLPVLLNLPGVRVAWITDANPARLDLLSRMYRVPALQVDDAVNAIGDLDVCLIAIPIGVRGPYLDACAAANVAVYVEKPFARSRQEHEKLASLFPEHALAIGFQRRFYRTAALMKRVVSECVFGDLDSIELAWGGYSLKSGGAGRHITDSKLSGGGILIESGIHALDHVLHTAAAEAVRVERVQAISFEGMDYDSVVQSTLTGPCGTVPVKSHVTRLTNLNQGFTFRFENAVVSHGLGPAGPVRVSPRGPAESSDALHLDVGEPDRDSAETVNQAFFLCWSEFLEGVRSKSATTVSASASKLTTGWIEDIYKNMADTQPGDRPI
jgi:predicted dehydrogenase